MGWYGASMPRHCTVCLHHELKAIDLALLSGEAVVPIGRRFGLAKSAVHRHKIKCLLGGDGQPERGARRAASSNCPQGKPQATSPSSSNVAPARPRAAGGTVTALKETPDLADLVGCMVRSLRRLENAAEQAAGGGQGAALAAASGQLHKAVDLLSRLIGAQEGGGQTVPPQVNIIFPAMPGDRAATAERTAPTIDMAADGAGPQPTLRRSVPQGEASRSSAPSITFDLPPYRTTRRDHEAEPAGARPTTVRAVPEPDCAQSHMVNNLRVPDFDMAVGHLIEH